MSTYMDWFTRGRDKSNCSNPCQLILTKAMKTSNLQKTSELNFKFPSRVKVVKSYQLYSMLSLLAEIGGYCGLFLGVSFNQITKITSYLLDWIQKYYNK